MFNRSSSVPPPHVLDRLATSTAQRDSRLELQQRRQLDSDLGSAARDLEDAASAIQRLDLMGITYASTEAGELLRSVPRDLGARTRPAGPRPDGEPPVADGQPEHVRNRRLLSSAPLSLTRGGRADD
jgi:hypothetical protein